MKMMNMKTIAMILVITTASVSFAQGTQTGGGKEKERSLEHMMLDLIPYLESSEGIESFPEVQDYNKSHPHETFSDLLRNTSVVLSPGSVKDGFDADRDCVSHFGDPKNRYIECNEAAILDPSKLENQPGLYGFLFHEILVQAEIEKSRTKNIPSDYHVSKRMEFHKESFEKWVPGKDAPVASVYDESTDLNFLFSCSDPRNGDYFQASTDNNYGEKGLQIDIDDCNRSVPPSSIKVVKKADFISGFAGVNNFTITSKVENQCGHFKLSQNEQKKSGIKIKLFQSRSHQSGGDSYQSQVMGWVKYSILGIPMKTNLVCSVNFKNLDKLLTLPKRERSK